MIEHTLRSCTSTYAIKAKHHMAMPRQQPYGHIAIARQQHCVNGTFVEAWWLAASAVAVKESVAPLARQYSLQKRSVPR